MFTVNHLRFVAVVFGNAETVPVLGGGVGGERGGVGGEAGIAGRWTEVRESHMALGNAAPNMPVAPTKGQIRTESKALHLFFK